MNDVAHGFLFGLGMLGAIFAVWLFAVAIAQAWSRSYWWRRDKWRMLLKRFGQGGQAS